MDNYKHRGLRKRLVDSLREKGIKSEAVLEAINSVPRHLFIDNAFESLAYRDKPFPIGSGQTISQPYTVAFQSELLNIKKGDRVLEIGTGSGYQACVLLELGAKVFTIERHKQLYNTARTFLPKIKYKPNMFHGDGCLGMPTYAPFDKVLVTAGAPYIPEPLKEQLKVGGILVIPVGNVENQVMTTLIKTGASDYTKKEYGDFSFVPLLDERSWG
ncbi:MAG TPA: protein-L-isoaspartate(D-aspartate) O-methyltransferase [Flavobacteriales bacterium]|nr:protein-L-isoaspartate(D-aspartate) O-methyltransferase [Flavobacteriales bacterium]HIO72850.1 protein-L-isoaspartate(D-aspartate) O-methyltransferase [Flavobacteriales bacterium]